MPVIPIESPDDPRLDPFRDLKTTNLNRWSDTLIGEGDKLLDRMLDVAWPLVSVVLSERHRERFERRIAVETPIYLLAHAQFDRLVGFNFHRGVLTIARRPVNPALATLLPPADRPSRLLFGVDLHDPENLGSILRSASAFGLDAVLLSASSADPFSRRVLRTSMGSVFQRPVARVDDAMLALDTLHAAGVSTYAAVVDADARPIDQVQPPARWAVFVGNEGIGLPREVAHACRQRVTIPMTPGMDSLNVAVATGIVLYQLSKPALLPSSI
jgi:tRNA G18 (ribose-2'-O)-methylase SpoU